MAGTATAVSNRVSRRQAGRWAAQDQQQYDQQQYEQQQYEQQQPAQPDMESKLAQLKDLGALKDQGVLSESEFQEQKDRILNS